MSSRRIQELTLDTAELRAMLRKEGGADGRDANFHTKVICAHCGRPGGNEVAFGDEIGPVWLHRECEAPWIERRMGEEGILRA